MKSFPAMRAAAEVAGLAAPTVDGFAIDFPSEVFQTVYDSDGRQDSSTPLGPLRVDLSDAARAIVARRGVGCVQLSLRRFDGQFLEEYDPEAGVLMPVHVPACVFTVGLVDGGRALSILMKRKHLPTSASFGNAPVVVVVAVGDGAGGFAQLAVSSRFSILSKEPRGRKVAKVPKRIRNPPPGKPVRGPASAGDDALTAALGCAVLGRGAVDGAALRMADDDPAQEVPTRVVGGKRSVRPCDGAESSVTVSDDDDDADEENEVLSDSLPVGYASSRCKTRRITASDAVVAAAPSAASLGLDAAGLRAALESGQVALAMAERQAAESDAEYDADGVDDDDDDDEEEVVRPTAAPPAAAGHVGGGGGLRWATSQLLPPPPPPVLPRGAPLPRLPAIGEDVFGEEPVRFDLLRADGLESPMPQFLRNDSGLA